MTGYPQSTFPSSEMMHISSTLLGVLLHPLHVIGDSSDWDHIPQESPTNESLILTGYMKLLIIVGDSFIWDPAWQSEYNGDTNHGF